jgi:hypothetical protein
MTMMPVLHGPRCVGFIFNRGKLGFEAFNSDERSLGTYPSQQEAAGAIELART